MSHRNHHHHHRHHHHRHVLPPPQPPPLQPPSLVATSLAPIQGLKKQHSWSPDMYREEAWLRRKGNVENKSRSKSLTDEDLDELKGCIELGFGFGSPKVDQRLSDTLPALELYYAVNKHYVDLSKSSPSLSTFSDGESPSPLGSPHTIFGPAGENDPQTVKTRLRQWAQVVACSVKQFSSR